MRLAASKALLRRRQSLQQAVGLHVLAWGRNVEGQCGTEDHNPLVTHPCSVVGLNEAPVTQLAAGKLASAAVLGTGDVLTWGCGKSGKLGQGNLEQLRAPGRVESLVGRAGIVAASLGDSHSLFLDQQGGMWSCGDNKEGQCGLGSPMQLLAAQQGMAHAAGHMQQTFRGFMQKAPANTDKYAQFLQQCFAQGTSTPRLRHPSKHAHMRSGWAATPLGVAGGGSNASGRLQQLAALAGSAGSTPLTLSGAAATGSYAVSSGLWGFDLEGHVTATGLQPGMSYMPARVGGSRQLPWAVASTAAAGAAVAARGAGGLEGERVVASAAARYFSVAVTDKGEVWTFGADYSGRAPASNWSRDAAPVASEAAAAIRAHGGAVAVAAGTSFIICLTASGKALVLGKLGWAWAGATGAAATPGATVMEVQGLPPLTGIAAGSQHALMTDGERVWAIGRWTGAGGEAAGAAPPCAPAEMLHLPAEGVAKVVAGAHASAVVSGDGQLFLWGRLVDSHHAEGLVRRFGADIMSDDVNWSWAGFGGPVPAKVDGLSRVRDVALGGWHALALVD